MRHVFPFRMLLPGLVALAGLACNQPVTPPPLAASTPLPAARARLATDPVAAPAATATATPVPAPTPTPAPQAPRTLVAIGASDIVGLGAEDPWNDSWADVLAAKLAVDGPPVELVELGFIGWVARHMREVELPKAIAAKPDLVVIWTGVNDISLGVSLDDFKRELAGLLDGVAATGAPCFLLNLPNIDRLPYFADQKDAYKAALPAWQAAVREVAKPRRTTVIDLAVFTTEIDAHPEYLAFDGFHPSTAGYKRLAEILYTTIKPTWQAPRAVPAPLFGTRGKLKWP